MTMTFKSGWLVEACQLASLVVRSWLSESLRSQACTAWLQLHALCACLHRQTWLASLSARRA